MTDELNPTQEPAKAARTKNARRPRANPSSHQDASPGAEKDIFVGVNGVGYHIKRGAEVEVPREVVTVLEESVKTVYEQVRNEDGSTSMIPRDVPTYPFQVKG